MSWSMRSLNSLASSIRSISRPRRAPEPHVVLKGMVIDGCARYINPPRPLRMSPCEVNNQRNDGHNEENMDECTGRSECKPTKAPRNEQYKKDNEKHVDLLCYLVVSHNSR